MSVRGWLSWAVLFVCLTVGSFVRSADESSEDYHFFSAKEGTPVRASMRFGSPIVAVLGSGAVGSFRRVGETRGCEKGWYERQSGGFVCGKHLSSTTQRAVRVAPDDDPANVVELAAYFVPKFGPRVFDSLSQADSGVAMVRLRKGSVVRAVGPVFRRNGKQLLRNRKGLYIEADRLVLLPAAERSLGVNVGPSAVPPLGVVTGRNVHVRIAPDPGSSEIASLPRWAWIPGSEVAAPAETLAPDAWVRLPSGGYVEKAQVSRYREPVWPADLEPQERWLAVDLVEQLAAAYQGKTLVRLMPCSTGEKGNTPPGEYRIEVKKRLHTMRLLMGQIRVEDVPWVMFFDRDEGLAIHSAYWHSDFGEPRSHGCVNLPEQDARWLYEWSWPLPAVEDSETVAMPQARSSRVVIF